MLRAIKTHDRVQNSGNNLGNEKKEEALKTSVGCCEERDLGTYRRNYTEYGTASKQNFYGLNENCSILEKFCDKNI